MTAANGAAPERCDIAVIGAGIVGLATARELARRHPHASIAVIDKETEIGRHQTGHNSGVIHAGIYYVPGSLKAQLCVSGARELYAYCDEHGIPVERCGKLIVALDASELPGLEELERRGRANGVPGLRRIGAGELRELEPAAAGVAALHSPATGIVDFGAVARALRADLEQAGGRVVLGSEVSGLSPNGRALKIAHAGGELHAGHALVCAGAWSDRLAVQAGALARAADRAVPRRLPAPARPSGAIWSAR